MRRVFEVKQDSNHFQYFLFSDTDWMEVLDSPISVGKHWVPPSAKLRKPQLPAGDFYNFDFYPLIITSRAREMLADQFVDTCELLPMTFECKTFFVVNVIKVVDCLDKKRTGWKKMETFFRNPFFDPKRLGDAPIFRLPGKAILMYVRETFKAAVEKGGLKGLIFKEVWNEMN